MSVIIGKRDPDEYVRIGDIERRNGLYILGKPRMGKSWLLINMILQDFQNGRGLFFIDPHGDAIDEIDGRTIPDVPKTILDPEDSRRSFGINILSCADITNHELRSDTFARAKGFFDKIWKNTFEERPWLQLILQNALYAFIENQGYTLAELPLFFRDRAFRAFICGNIKYNVAVRDYWLKTFASKDKRDQETQIEAAQTRLEILLGHPAVRHIVGQEKTTIDLQDVVNSGKALLLKFSSATSIEDKKIIGTLLVSELLSAIQKRPADNKNLFCIYIDEFQNFASFEDFAVLITQAPKYGISTTLAHHERFGQLSDDHAIAGATSAIVNKIIFQVTGKDAQDLAPEFASSPPTEMRTEEILSVSQNPVRDLLNGHQNREVRTLVDRSIRPIKERLEALKAEIESKKILRMEYYDEAALSRIYTHIQIERQRHGFSNNPGNELALGEKAGIRAHNETIALAILTGESASLEALLRDANKLLVSVMEGRINVKRDSYCKSLAGIAERFYVSNRSYKHIIELYLLLLFGNRQRTRLVPSWFAEEEKLFEDFGGIIRVEARSPGVPEPPKGYIDIHPYSNYERNEVLSGIRRAIDRLNPVILPTLEAVYALGKCLADPNNHIKTRTGQQVITEKPARTIADMVNEMARELTELPKYTAYAKILDGGNMWKGKLRTLKLPEYMVYGVIPAFSISLLYPEISKERSWIEEEIQARQTRWKPAVIAMPYVSPAKAKKKQEEEPPPTRY